MGKEKLEDLRYHKRKRNLFLFFLLCIFFFIPGSFLVLMIADVDMDLLSVIYAPLFVIALVIILKFRSRLLYHNMYYQYFLMINDNLGIIKLPHKIFTPSWINNLKAKGYNKEYNMSEFMYFYQVVPKIHKYIHSNRNVVLICAIAKNEKFDFYSDVFDNEIKRIYETDQQARKARTQIVFQFKKFTSYDDAIKAELDQIINFKHGRDNLIHINIGYFVEQNSIYFLRPNKRYPNKYYYYATSLIKEYCGLIS